MHMVVSSENFFQNVHICASCCIISSVCATRLPEQGTRFQQKDLEGNSAPHHRHRTTVYGGSHMIFKISFCGSTISLSCTVRRKYWCTEWETTLCFPSTPVQFWIPYYESLHWAKWNWGKIWIISLGTFAGNLQGQSMVRKQGTGKWDGRKYSCVSQRVLHVGKT